MVPFVVLLTYKLTETHFNPFLMKHILILTATLIYATHLCAQGFKRVEHIQGPGNENIYDLSVDKQGNIISVGSFSNAADFDGGSGITKLSSNGASDIFIRKTNSGGNLLWVKSIGGLGDDKALAVITDSAGNIYVSGSFFGAAAFNPPGGDSLKADQPGNSNFFLMKLSGNGNFQWAVKESSNNPTNDYTTDAAPLALDKTGKIYMAYGFAEMSYTNVCKYNPTNGQKEQSFSFTTTGGSNPGVLTEGLSVDTGGNFYISGSFTGDVDFDPGNGTDIRTANSERAFVGKYKPTGNISWLHTFGSNVINSPTSANTLATDLQGNVFFSGLFSGAVDFEPGNGIHYITSGANNLNMFLAKFTTAGNLSWVNPYIYSGGGNYPYDLTTDAIGNVYMTGIFESTTTDFNPAGSTPNIPVAKGADMFVIKVAPGGMLVWLEHTGGKDISRGLAIAVSPGEETYIGGDFRDTADFTPLHNFSSKLIALGQEDAFILKLGKCALQDTSVVQSGKMLKSNATGVSYQWISCADKMPVPFATNHEFTPWTPGQYAVVITNIEGCSDTSACYEVTLSIDQLNKNNTGVYPNPTTGDVTVTLGKHYETIKATLTDISGRIISVHTYTKTDNFTMPVNAPQGIYRLNVTTDDTINIPLRIMKQ